MSRHVGIVPLRKLVKQPYHYSDTSKRSVPMMSDQITEEQSSSIDDSTYGTKPLK